MQKKQSSAKKLVLSKDVVANLNMVKGGGAKERITNWCDSRLDRCVSILCF